MNMRNSHYIQFCFDVIDMFGVHNKSTEMYNVFKFVEKWTFELGNVSHIGKIKTER